MYLFENEYELICMKRGGRKTKIFSTPYLYAFSIRELRCGNFCYKDSENWFHQNMDFCMRIEVAKF
jgi:hypothetical protein